MKTISSEQVQKIENVCLEPMTKLGYAQYNSDRKNQGDADSVKSAILFFVLLSLAVPLRVLAPVGDQGDQF